MNHRADLTHPPSTSPNPCTQATSPNLLAAYVRVLPGESVETQACATSQVGC